MKSDPGGPFDRITAVILTLDEESQIGECLSAIPQEMPKVVIDSGSTDATLDIARSMGVSVFHRPWTGFADQRNFALRDCGIKTEWVLFIDADEIYSVEFYKWLSDAHITDNLVDVYQVPSVLVLGDKVLRFAPGYPVLHPRLVRISTTFRVNHSGHGEAVEPCRSAVSPYGYNHYFQSGDLTPWLRKHIGLAGLEAASGAAASTSRGRAAQRVPRGAIRALARFAYHFVFRMGFRDGLEGYQYSLMYTWYELTVYLIQASRRG